MVYDPHESIRVNLSDKTKRNLLTADLTDETDHLTIVLSARSARSVVVFNLLLLAMLPELTG